MQLYALDGAQPLLATEALKDKIYHCPECHTPLKVRSGPSRRPHFYHLDPFRQCRQKGKSEEHLALQLTLTGLLGTQAHMECPFPSIGRIADVAWHEQKMVFEIQCSPISLEEVQERCSDYQSAGYAVFWILHDKRFNGRRLCAAELHLRATGCYFTNIDRLATGEIYDQFEVIDGHRRLFKGPPLPIHPKHLSPIPPLVSNDIPLPASLLERLHQWKYYIKGDLLHRLLQERSVDKTAKHLMAIEAKYKTPQGRTRAQRLPLLTLLRKSYSALICSLIKNI